MGVLDLILADDGHAVVGLELVVAVAVGYLPAVVGIAEDAGAEADGVHTIDAQIVQQGGHDVGLLHDAVFPFTHTIQGTIFGGKHLLLRRIEHHGNAVPAVVVVVFAVETLARVVGGDDEEGVLVPVGLAGGVGCAVVFQNGKTLKTLPEKDALEFIKQQILEHTDQAPGS